MFSTDFIFGQQENLVDNQKFLAGFRLLCNKILLCLSYRVNLAIPATQPMQLRVFTIHRIRTLIVMVIVKSCTLDFRSAVHNYKITCLTFGTYFSKACNFKSMFTKCYSEHIHSSPHVKES